MKVKTELLQAFMQKNELSAAILAREMGVTVGEVEKLLGGTAVNEETARRFIYYFGADNEGHIFIKLTNLSNEGKTLCVCAGEAFAQGIFLPFGITHDDAERGVRTGGFGSTNFQNEEN